MSDVLDPGTMEETLLSASLESDFGFFQEAPVDQESLVLVEDNTSEEWRKQAHGQIDSLVRVFCSMAILAALGIIWVCLITIVSYEDILRRRLMELRYT